MVGKIKEMKEKGYFPEGEGRALGAETVPELNGDEAVIYEDFFIMGLHMPPHPTLANILLYIQAQLHQLTPNALLSKKIMGSQQLRWHAFREFVCETLRAALSAEDRVDPKWRSNCSVWMLKFSC
jgi:hypothetical protein